MTTTLDAQNYSQTMTTTTLMVKRPRNFSQLEQSFKLIRYRVPDDFRFKKDRYKYGRLHSQFKRQISYPYRLFTHDKNPNSGKDEIVIYVLYPASKTEKDVVLDFLSSDPLSYARVPFNHPDFHVLLKLILGAWFQGRTGQEFVSHGEYYVFVKPGKFKHTCLEIELKGDPRNQETDELQLFRLLGHANDFVKKDIDAIPPGFEDFTPYFTTNVDHGKPVVVPLNSEKVRLLRGNVFARYQRPDRRASLEYHSVVNPETTRAKTLYDVGSRYIEYLSEYGIEAWFLEREFTEYKPALTDSNLPIENMGIISLYDNRLGTNVPPIDAYQSALESRYQNLEFEVVSELDVSDSRPILLLQDYNKDDFVSQDEEGGKSRGILAGKPDPYQIVYGNPLLAGIPKQSINVNLNDSDDYDQHQQAAYLAYDMVDFENDPAYGIHFDVALNQLFLKWLVLQRRDAVNHLPGFRKGKAGIESDWLQHALVRKKTRGGKRSWILLYVDREGLHFFDLTIPKQKGGALYNVDSILAGLGLDWEEDVLIPLAKKYHRDDPNDERDLEDRLNSYDLILGPGLVVDIEDMDERVLYDYPEIIRRGREMDEARPVEDFRLAEHYNQVRTQNTLSHDELDERGLLDDPTLAKTRREQESLRLLNQLKEFDGLLDQIARDRFTISFNELTSEPYLTEVLRIFETPTRRKLQNMYKSRDMFRGIKEKELQAAYSGIWYDPENAYMIGSPDSIKQSQPRAHLIRRFDVLRGEDDFRIEPFLDAMGVTFVRYNQYTVFPYLFSLIDVFGDLK